MSRGTRGSCYVTDDYDYVDMIEGTIEHALSRAAAVTSPKKK